MKTPSYLIQIPEPCHEDWNAMQPDAKGKFCTSCSKAVIDFSNKTDTEIRDILIEYKEQKVCGHFKKSQVNRPLNITINLNNLPRNVSSTKVFAIAVFLAFGTFLFSCTNHEGKKVEAIELLNISDSYTTGLAIVPMEATDSIAKKDSIKTSPSFCPSEIMGDVAFGKIMPREDTLEEVMTGEIEPQIMGGIRYVIEDTMASVPDSSEIKMPEKVNDQTTINKQSPDLVIYPNPGNGEFTIKYDVLKRANVRIDLFDLNGSWVKTLVDVKEQYEGHYTIPVDLKSLATGIYLVNMINAGERVTEKLVIEK